MPDVSRLTKRQRLVFDFIVATIRSGQPAPTIREICEAANISSPNGAVCHLKALTAKGFIRMGEPNKSRSIALVADRPGVCPTCGNPVKSHA